MSQEWYYSLDGDRWGPVVAADLKKLAEAGTLKPCDMVWKDGMPEWVEAKALKGLFGGTPKSGEQPAAEKPKAEAADKRPSSRGQPGDENTADPIISISSLASSTGRRFRALQVEVAPQHRRDEKEDDERPRSPRRNDEDRAEKQIVVVYRPRAQVNHKARLYLAIAGLLALVLITGVVLLLIPRDPPSSPNGKSPSTENSKSTLDWMAKVVNKQASVDAKKNQFASKQAEKEMLAELRKNDGKEQTWTFEVIKVTDKVSIHNEYVFLDNDSWIPAHKYDPFGDLLNSKRAPSKVGSLACFVFTQAKSPRRDVFSDIGTHFEIGNGKLIPPATANVLAQGYLVTIKGKVHLNPIDSGSQRFELEIVDASFVNAVKGTTEKPGSNDTDVPCCGPGGACGGCVTACGGIVVVMIVVPLVILVLVVAPMFVGMWKSFEKAGEPGWPALVPIYNYMIMAKIAGKDPNYALLGLIPFAGPIFLIIIIVEYCKKFEVGGGFAVGVVLLPFVFWPLLGFGSARYIGGVTERGVRRRHPDEEE